MLSTNKEDYLRAIHHLLEENSIVKSVEVADYLNVSKPSVSEMLKILGSENFVEYKKYGRIKLTRKGFKRAQNLTARHRIIETFLKDILKINPQKIHEEAHKLEHAFSDESINKLRQLLNYPTIDPHGKPIPN